MVSDMVMEHTDNERGNLLLPFPRLLFLINSKGSFRYTILQTGKYIPQPLLHQLWSTGCSEKLRNGSTMWDQSDDPLYYEWIPLSYIMLPNNFRLLELSQFWCILFIRFNNAINTFYINGYIITRHTFTRKYPTFYISGMSFKIHYLISF